MQRRQAVSIRLPHPAGNDADILEVAINKRTVTIICLLVPALLLLGFVCYMGSPFRPPPATNIWEACRYGDLEFLRRELAAGANPNEPDPRWNRVPLSCAAIFNHSEAVQILLDAGADPNFGHPLIQAAASRADDVAVLLIKAGASPDQQDESGKAALHYAVAYGNDSSVRLLIAAGATIDLRAEGGWTPLLMAASTAKVGAVEILLGAGADQTLRTDSGVSAYDLAKPRGPLSSDYERVRQLVRE